MFQDNTARAVMLWSAVAEPFAVQRNLMASRNLNTTKKEMMMITMILEDL